MKILYVKNNSERREALQLKTVIFEKDGQKFVKKEAMNADAIAHLKAMKINYYKLMENIVNPKIKLVKIIEESEKSLTFEFIEGISLEQKFYDAIKKGEDETQVLIDEYIDLLMHGFKTKPFENNSIDKNAYIKLFGQNNYQYFNNETTFENISNIDLIFSNLLYSGDSIYIIDYEWVFDIELPVNFIIFRQFENFIFSNVLRKRIYDRLNISASKYIFSQMNQAFISHYITNELSFYQYHTRYKKNNPNCYQLISKINKEVHNSGKDLAYATSIVELRDKQIAFLSELTLKRRIKQKIKKIIPNQILKLFGFTPYAPLVLPNETVFDEPNNKQMSYGYINPTLSPTHIQKMQNFKKEPLISIIMPVYNVSPKWLDLAIESIKSQWYKNWELCIADDKSTNEETLEYLHNLNHPNIKVTYLEKNLNISGASNAALESATGEYIALLDNDDEITPDALYEMVKAINEKEAEFIYSDEDFISVDGEISNPHFKPDFSPDLLLTHNYITHFTCFSRALLDKVGNFNAKFDGSQDFDLFLRLTEQTSKIYHIPKVLYHWRMLETSTSINSEAKPEALERGRGVLQEALQRRNIDASVEHGNMHHYYRIKYFIKDNPLVSIIIPFKDKPELLDMSINSILNKSSYQNYEIIGMSNNSEEPETFKKMAELEKKDTRVSFYEYNTEFNYADINNHAVNTYAKGEHILLLNNDIEVISPEWIEAMLEHSQRKEIGCVGAKLYYPDDTVQHAGIIIGLGGYAGHSHKMSPRDNPGYFNRLNAIQNVSAVTAACLMVKTSIYKALNGLDAVHFKVAYNDVDFCLRVREKGYLNLFTPYAEMYHHESISRGYETTPEKIERFQKEKDALMARHQDILTHGDPYYNPNLTHDKEDFSLCPKQA